MKRLLVVEDSSLVHKILRHLFKNAPDYELTICSAFADTRTLVEAQGVEDFFLAVVDLNLPDAPNGEVLDYLLERKLPCVVLTGSYDDQTRERILEKPIVDYVVKESRYSYEYVIKLADRLDKNQAIKVLVADDSQTQRSFIKTLLRRHLYQVHEAENAKQALAFLNSNPDTRMLITDYNMPDVSGIDLVKAIRGDADKNDLVIIGLSSHGSGGLSAKFIKNGANDFLTKPFFHEEFYCRINHNIEELEIREQLRDIAYRDALTGLSSRHYFFEEGERLYAQCLKKARPCSLAVIDIDYFKRINDEHGHDGGDMALRQVGALLNQAFGRFLVCRLGGEEFGVLLPGMDGDKTYKLLESFRALLEEEFIQVGADNMSLTVSIGYSTDMPDSLDELVKIADAHLYDAKSQGRNLVIGDYTG